jgi:hypothetical protein
MPLIKVVYQEFGGGIHPPADDIPGRIIGSKVGPAAFDFAQSHFLGTAN